MNRRDMLLATGAAVGMSTFPLGWAAGDDKKKKDDKKKDNKKPEDKKPE